MKTLADWLSYLEQLHPSAIDMGLERAGEVARRLGLGRPASTVITVTGTNGKGSTCALLASLLHAQGHRVGVYSSPHLLRYNERVRINGQDAGDADLCAAFEAVEQARGEISLTYFEMGTLAAFWLFERAALDFAVLEVGLGGRLDAVNLVDADLALVTSIAVDHSEWLGNTRESVAVEKAGIFRAGKPALCGDPQPPAVLEERAHALGAPFWLRGRDFDLSIRASDWEWRGRDARGAALTLREIPLLSLPMQNAALALQAYALLDQPWQPERLKQALREARVTGRLDRRALRYQGRSVSLLLDVGHNPHAAAYLAERLERCNGRRLAVFGLLADKDLEGVLDPLLAKVDHWAVADLPTVRTRSGAALAAALQARGAQAASYPSIAAALDAQCGQAGEDDEVLVFGSFYCVAEALEWLGQARREDA